MLQNRKTAIVAIALLFSGCAGERSETAAALPQSAPLAASWTSTCSEWDDWDKPGPPFRIHGNTYYVGTCGISAILIAGNKGHILIDGGTAKGGDVIARNIEQLGFAMSDVKVLLHSHEHFDHAAGLANLQRRSGARLLATSQAAPVLSSGITAKDDPQFGTHDPFEPARVDGIVQPGHPIILGNIELTPIATPGHTPGALSWSWKSCADAQCLNIVYADSLSAISNETYRFSDHPEYVAAYRKGIDRLAELPCDILVTPHPSASELRRKLISGDLQSGMKCATYAETIRTRLAKRLGEESGK